MEKQKTRIIKKEEISKRIEGFDSVRDYPVEELSKNGVVPVFRVKKATMDDQIQARELSSQPFALLSKVIQAMKKGEKLSKEEMSSVITSPEIHPKTDLNLRIFQRCVVKPKFKYSEVLKMSEVYPELVNDVCAFALGLRPEEDK